ncbi:MAG: hypothetical protein P9L91_04850 [Candidatus Zophobacter franzmannii]|nr:hypothetical protein [Candidatus Zophobacter franzmannii]
MFYVLRLSRVAVQAELASLQSVDKTNNWTARRAASKRGRSHYGQSTPGFTWSYSHLTHIGLEKGQGHKRTALRAERKKAKALKRLKFK